MESKKQFLALLFLAFSAALFSQDAQEPNDSYGENGRGAGLYFLKIETGKGTTSTQFVKN